MKKPSSRKNSPKPLSSVELFKRSQCPIINSLVIIGDKWTFVVIHDLFLGKKTFGDFQSSPEGIPTKYWLSDSNVWRAPAL